MIIEKIKSPADLKNLSISELNQVADETRQAILNRVSKHGGHIGPNLGFVEATVALHYVFDAPKDKFVFDVSHQSYPHKVLTGRASGFLGDVDDMNAISGYSSPAESPVYDNFEVGHTSTSVSLATGLQKARDINGTDENIIAITKRRRGFRRSRHSIRTWHGHHHRGKRQRNEHCRESRRHLQES